MAGPWRDRSCPEPAIVSVQNWLRKNPASSRRTVFSRPGSASAACASARASARRRSSLFQSSRELDSDRLPLGSTGAPPDGSRASNRTGCRRIRLVHQRASDSGAATTHSPRCFPSMRGRAPANNCPLHRVPGLPSHDPAPRPAVARRGTIALVRANEPTAAAMLPAVKLSGDHKAHVLRIIQIALGGRLEQAQIRTVDRNDRLAKRVGLIDSPELGETVDRARQVGSDAVGLSSGVEGQCPIKLIGVFVIAVEKNWSAGFALRACRRIAPWQRRWPISYRPSRR